MGIVFSASILPEDATNKQVQWNVSHGSGSAFITAGGLLTAGIPGTVEVFATAMDGSGISSAPLALDITAPPVPISSIEVSAEGGLSELESGQRLQFSANILPQDASNPYLLWSIHALSGTASISDQGLLTAGDPGEVEAYGLRDPAQRRVPGSPRPSR